VSAAREGVTESRRMTLTQAGSEGETGQVRKTLLRVIALLLTALVFAADVKIPLGVAAGVPYVAVILVALGQRGKRDTIFFAITCSVLTLIGLGVSPSPGGAEIWTVLANRSLALFAIWVTAGIGLQRKRAEERLEKVNESLRTRARERSDATKALANRVERQEVATKLGLRTLEGVSPETLIQESLEALAGTLGLGYAKLLELVPGGRTLRLVAGVGWRPGLVGTYTVIANPGTQSGFTLSSERPVIAEDIRSDARFRAMPLLEEHGVVSGMSVIVHGDEEPYGVLGVHTRRKHRFSEEDVLFLQSVANLVALAMRRQKADQALHESEARARAAEDLASIAELASGLAHEIGTPMNIILGYARMLEGTLVTDKERERAQMICEQTKRVAKLIQTLLNLAHPRPSDTLEEALGFVKEKLRIHGIVVERKFDDTPAIRGDPEKLQQLFLNFFINAVDAMPDGGVLRVSIVRGDSSEVQVRVADTGIGISSETIGKIFEPFHTTKPRGKGSGLGLAVSKNIALEHQARIEVTSQVGNGTEFTIRFPEDSGE
jgi:signal transduction histidine kinase